jgi:hypothetical protein
MYIYGIIFIEICWILNILFNTQTPLCSILCPHSSVITLKFHNTIRNAAGVTTLYVTIKFLLCGDSTAKYNNNNNNNYTETARLLKTCSAYSFGSLKGTT